LLDSAGGNTNETDRPLLPKLRVKSWKSQGLSINVIEKADKE
jgi:hypothetical protein